MPATTVFFSLEMRERTHFMALRTPPAPPPSILQPVLAQQCYSVSCYMDTAEAQVVQKQSIKECLKGIAQLPCKRLASFTFKKRPIHISLVKAYKIANNVVNREQTIYVHLFL